MFNVEKLDHEGRGVIRQGKVTFVENALPNELVEIKILKEKKNYIEAESIKIENPSKDRCNPNCKYFNNCGGCNLLHMNYESTLNFKENKIKEIIAKFLKEDIKINKIIPTIEPFNYRNKATFHVKKQAGYYKKNSNEIINIDNCNLVDNSINKILKNIKEINLNNIYEIIIRKSKYIDNSMIIIKVNKDINEKEIIGKLNGIVTSIIIYQNKKYKTIYGSNYILEQMNEFKFKISEDSFFQVNTKTAITLYEKVVEYINVQENENILDLYCGTGTIGIFLSKKAKKVTGIEINASAINNAIENSKINNINNIEFICKDSSKAVLELKEHFDKIIVDPPRAGLDRNTIKFLKESKAKKIVYVSCDPVTLARDLNLLKENYNIKEITPVDMFPYTHHVETVSLLEIK